MMESDSSELTDEGKRRREIDEVEERIFEKTKKTARTPQKKAVRYEDKIDKIMNMLQTLTANMHDIRNEQKEMRKEQKQYYTELTELKKECKQIKKENEK